MFDHPIIDVALGLVLLYTLLSLVASGVQELVASARGLRAKNLYKGIANLLDGPGADAQYARLVYEHPLVKNLAKPNNRPSYIPSAMLSAVLLDILAREKLGKPYSACDANDVRQLASAIDAAHPLRRVLEVLVAKSGSPAKLRRRVTAWFDEGMDRVSGWYRREVKVYLVVTAFVLAAGVNASSLEVAEQLWRNESTRTAIALLAEEVAERGTEGIEGKYLRRLDVLPLGWFTSSGELIDLPDGCMGWLVLLLGWAITAVAVSLGAPFWFDALSRVARLKGAGGKSRPTAGG